MLKNFMSKYFMLKYFYVKKRKNTSKTRTKTCISKNTVYFVDVSEINFR